MANKDLFKPEEISSEKSGHRVRAKILPRLGANLVSLEVDGRELLYFSKERFLDDEFYSGCFNMFPTVCRLHDCQYVFQGKKIKQRKHGKDVFIHGLVRDEEFSVARKDEELTCTIEMDENHPVYEGYPFPCRFSLKYRLLDRGLEVQFDFENRGNRDAPFGYGLHPFWRMEGSRTQKFIKVPCQYLMELKDLIPTGELTPVEGTELDLRSYRCLEGITVDNLFWGTLPGENLSLEFRDSRLRLVLQTSEEFSHMVVYTPPGEPYACLENYTCAPNAPNLHSDGKQEISGLKVVSPGENFSGWIRFILEDI